MEQSVPTYAVGTLGTGVEIISMGKGDRFRDVLTEQGMDCIVLRPVIMESVQLGMLRMDNGNIVHKPAHQAPTHPRGHIDQ